MKKILAVLTVLTFVVAANAAGTVSGTTVWGLNQAEPVNGTGGGYGNLPNAGTAYYNARILVNVGAGDDWTAINTNITLSNATFYQGILNLNPPPPGVFPGTPDEEYDTYFTIPSGWPNSMAGGSASFAAGPTFTATTASAAWFDTVNDGAGQYYLMNITVIPDAGHATDWTGTVSGSYTMALTGGTPFSYGFSIPLPEPASLALLALGSLALIRRR